MTSLVRDWQISDRRIAYSLLAIENYYYKDETYIFDNYSPKTVCHEYNWHLRYVS